MSRFHPLDFRLMAMSQFQILTLLCQTAAWTISSDLNQFLTQQLATSQALSREVFEAQVVALVEQMQTTTVANVKYTDPLVSLVILNSGIMSALNTNTYVIDNPLVSSYRILHGSYPVGNYIISNASNLNNIYCSCAYQSNCTFQAGYYNYSIRPGINDNPVYQPSPPPMFIVPGMLVGCLPRDAMLLSTLECFYNRSCLDLIGISQAIIPLNATVPSRFRVNTTASIQHDVFLSISPRLHQVCSSDFVVEQWWGYLWGLDAVINFRDLKLLSIQFRILASLCSLAQQSIDNDKSAFFTNKLVTLELISFSSFQAQIDSLTATFIAQTPDKFRRTQSFIYETFRANQLLVVPETNWQLAFTTAADNYVVATVPRNSFGNNYSCITSLDSFSRPLYIDGNYNTTVLPGVVASCLPIDGIRLSTLECFFDSNCILNLTSIASTRTTTIWIAKPLNASIPSNYSSNTLIGNLVDSLFVEDWGIK
ncbi:unnamed protein product, partial [Adineta steineri]